MKAATPSIREHRDGWLLSVRVSPRAGRTEITGVADDGAITVRLAAAPVDGRANSALVEVIADALGVPRSRVSVVSGQTARRKTVLVETGASEAEVAGQVMSATPTGA